MVHARIGLKLGCVEVRYLVDVCAAVPDKVEDGGEAASLEYCPRLTGAHQLQHLDALLRQIAARPTHNQSILPLINKIITTSVNQSNNHYFGRSINLVYQTFNQSCIKQSLNLVSNNQSILFELFITINQSYF